MSLAKRVPFLGLPFFGAKRLVTLRVNFGRFYILVLGILGSCKIHTSHCHRTEVEIPRSPANTSLFLIVWPPALDLMAHWRIANASLDSLLRYEVMFFFCEGESSILK